MVMSLRIPSAKRHIYALPSGDGTRRRSTPRRHVVPLMGYPSLGGLNFQFNRESVRCPTATALAASAPSARPISAR